MKVKVCGIITLLLTVVWAFADDQGNTSSAQYLPAGLSETVIAAYMTANRYEFDKVYALMPSKVIEKLNTTAAGPQTKEMIRQAWLEITRNGRIKTVEMVDQKKVDDYVEIKLRIHYQNGSWQDLTDTAVQEAGAWKIGAIPVLKYMAAYGISASMAENQIKGQLARLKQRRTMADMRSLSTTLERYSIDHKRYPDSTGRLGDLATALQPADMQLRLVDAWGHPFVYKVDESHRRYWIISYGADGLNEPGIYDSNGIPLPAAEGQPESPDSDLIFSDGSFIREPKEEKVEPRRSPTPVTKEWEALAPFDVVQQAYAAAAEYDFEKANVYLLSNLVPDVKQRFGALADYEIKKAWQITTKDGTIRKIELVSQKSSAKDVFLNSKAYFSDGSSEDRHDYLLKEDGVWKTLPFQFIASFVPGNFSKWDEFVEAMEKAKAAKTTGSADDHTVVTEESASRPDAAKAGADEKKERTQDLLLAATLGYASDVDRWLKQGADPNAVDEKSGKTALMLAAMSKSPETVDRLLKAGADVNMRGKDGETALFAAVSQNREDCIRLLLERGADPQIKDTSGQTAWMIAAWRGRVSILELFYKYGVTKDEELRYLCEYGPSVDELQRILKEGASANSSDEAGVTPLMTAVRRGRTDFVKALMDAGADIEQKSRDGVGALTLAIAYGRFDLIKIFADNGMKFQRSELDRYLSSARIQAGKDPQQRTLVDMRAISAACQAYALEHHKYPESPSGRIEAVARALQPTYISQLPAKDAWGQPFSYYSFPDGTGFSLVSAGQNGKKDLPLYDAKGFPPSFQKQYSGEAFTFNFNAIEANDLFRFLADISGKKIILDPALQRKEVTTSFIEVPWDLAMDVFSLVVRAVPTIESDETHFNSVPGADDIFWIVLYGKGACH